MRRPLNGSQQHLPIQQSDDYHRAFDGKSDVMMTKYIGYDVKRLKLFVEMLDWGPK